MTTETDALEFLRAENARLTALLEAHGDDSSTYRDLHTTRLADSVSVLHVFQKKTQATSKRDIELAKQRFALLRRK